MSPEAPPIDLARYAEVMAHLRRFPPHKGDEVLARLGLRRAAWQAAATRWTAARDAELASGKAELTVRFGAAFARTRRRLEAQRPSLESLGPLRGPDEVAVAPSAPPPPVEAAPPVIQLISAQLAPPQPDAPSFLVRQPARYEAPAIVTAPLAPVPASHQLHATLPLGASLPIAGLPFSEATAASEKAFAVQGPVEPRRDPQGFGSTVGLSGAPLAPALPFVGGPGVAELTMAQYASLRVELQMHPDRAAAILGRYGVPAEARAALEAHWRARFGADPMLRMEFARAFAAYTAWLRSNAG